MPCDFQRLPGLSPSSSSFPGTEYQVQHCTASTPCTQQGVAWLSGFLRSLPLVVQCTRGTILRAPDPRAHLSLPSFYPAIHPTRSSREGFDDRLASAHADPHCRSCPLTSGREGLGGTGAGPRVEGRGRRGRLLLLLHGMFCYPLDRHMGHLGLAGWQAGPAGRALEKPPSSSSSTTTPEPPGKRPLSHHRSAQRHNGSMPSSSSTYPLKIESLPFWRLHCQSHVELRPAVITAGFPTVRTWYSVVMSQLLSRQWHPTGQWRFLLGRFLSLSLVRESVEAFAGTEAISRKGAGRRLVSRTPAGSKWK